MVTTIVFFGPSTGLKIGQSMPSPFGLAAGE